jgi:hypothetical protein
VSPLSSSGGSGVAGPHPRRSGASVEVWQIASPSVATTVAPRRATALTTLGAGCFDAAAAAETNAIGLPYE